MGVDPTPAPLGDVSIGAAMEAYTGAKFGSSGTMTAALIITTAVKAVPVKQIGYSGLMVPVMEDKRLAQALGRGHLQHRQPAGLFGRMWHGTRHHSTARRRFRGADRPHPGRCRLAGLEVAQALSARLLPVKGKKAGDTTEFQDQFLFNTSLHPLP